MSAIETVRWPDAEIVLLAAGRHCKLTYPEIADMLRECAKSNRTVFEIAAKIRELEAVPA